MFFFSNAENISIWGDNLMGKKKKIMFHGFNASKP